MYNHNPGNESDAGNLRVLESVDGSPAAAYESDEAVRAAFDAELRKLAEEIVQFHPSLTQLLLSLGDQGVANPIHGQN
jgi:hypothetical protein